MVTSRQLRTTLSVLLLSATPILALARGQDYTPQSLLLDVYPDGYVQVIYILTVNDTIPTIIVPVFGTNTENLLVLDENGTVLEFYLEGSALGIYTLGATEATIDYDTPDLTTKFGPIWTVNITSPLQFQVKLPQAATIMDLSSEPTSIEETNGRLLVGMPPGTQWISYFQEETTTTQPAPAITLPWALAIGALGAATGAGLLMSLSKLLKRPKLGRMFGRRAELRQEEEDVVAYLAEKGGTAFESELRDRFQTMAKTSLWRLLKRLQAKGVVEIEKVGSQNRIRLK